jgi:hypothetical protein
MQEKLIEMVWTCGEKGDDDCVKRCIRMEVVGKRPGDRLRKT